MFEVKVTVELPGIPEAINNLAGSIGKIAGFSVASMTPAGFSIASTTPAVVSTENPVAADTAEAPVAAPAPVEQPEQAPPLVNVPDTPIAPAAPVEQPVAAPAAPAPVAPAPAPAKKYTFKQISKAGAALCTEMGKMDQLVTLLNTKYGVPAITMINESRYGELAEDLIALGATIEEE